MKKYFIFLVLICFTFCGTIFAVPANPNLIEVKQPDGTKIKIKNKGDEFYGWHEDKDGYTIIKDTTTKFWSYAQENDFGDLISSKIIVGKTKPQSLGIKKFLRNKNKIYKAQQVKRTYNSQLNQVLKSNSISALKSSSQQTSEISGKKTNFVLLVQFRDLKFKDNPPFSSTSTEKQIIAEFDDLFNKTNYTKDGAVGSVKDYFKEVSYGKLEYNSVISPIITIDQSYTYYSYSNGEYISFTRVREMIKTALKQLDDSGYNFKDIWPSESKPEGFTVIHAGGGAENHNYDFIWSHKSTLSPSVTHDGITFTNYHTEPAGRGYYGNEGLERIGTICHESIHFFGIPDLYDTNYTSEGLGNFCIMAGGSWNGREGHCPAHPCAWIKYTLGWCSPKAVSEGTNSIGNSSKDSASFYKLTSTNFNNKEYFLIENKQGYGFDKYLPGKKRGLLIYHIDEAKSDNDDPTHYMVDIEEADGTSDWTKDHLATSQNTGLDSDYYRNGTVTVFNDFCSSSPNSRSYYKSSGQYKVSGIDISNISNTASIMYFDIPETESLENFVDELNDDGLAFVNKIMNYRPEKTKEELKNLKSFEQKELAKYFTITRTGAIKANSMAEIYFDFINNELVCNIGKDKTGLVDYRQANYIIELNSILKSSKQSITSVGNISEGNNSPLNNLTEISTTLSNKRFTGKDAIKNIEHFTEDLGCLIYTFNKMSSNTGYDVIEVVKDMRLDMFPEYTLIKGKNSLYFDDLSKVVVYPNPARNNVVNFINLPTEATKLDIEIYTITGQFVKSFNIEDTSTISTGNKKLLWNCKNYSGASVAPGIYVALLKTNSDKKTIKFAIIK